MPKLLSQSKHKLLLYLAFWAVVFMINLGYDWHRFASLREALEVGGLKTLSQGLVAFLALHLLVPKLLNHERHLTFTLLLLLLAFMVAELFISVSYLYLEPTYPLTYGAYYNTNLSDYSLIERLGFSDMIRYIIISKIPTLLFPTVILIAVNFYEKQKHLLALKEQKQAAELNALKNQLNPHFIFNTLNNIYSMAINGSPSTAEAVAKLSGIFDYVLYQCNEHYVSLTAEVDMIENYIALEALRYGERVQVSFSTEINASAKVAPLLYLSLVENAFKHGAGQELDQAHINIELSADEHLVHFSIQNSKPSHGKNQQPAKSIGSDNLRKQLKLLYPKAHQLDIIETESDHTVTLKLHNRCPKHD